MDQNHSQREADFGILDQFRLASHPAKMSKLGDEGPKYQNFGVLCRRHWEASNVAEAQPNVTRGFWSGERITKCGVCQKKSQGEMV